MVQQGYKEWQAEHGTGPTAINSVELDFMTRPPAWRLSPGPGTLAALDGTHVTQNLVFYSDAPLSLRATAASVEITYASTGTPVLWYPGSWWIVDRWSVPLGGAGRTTWRTSRRLPVDVPGMAEFTAPPQLQVYVDGALRGDITLPSTNNGPGGWCAEITTPDLSAEGAQVLELRYPPEWLVRFTDVEIDPTIYNRYLFRAEVEEVLRGEYTDL